MIDTDIQSCHSKGRKSKLLRPQITMMGAMAISGMVWLAITWGTRARSKRPEVVSTMAMPRPTTTPMANPTAASRSVKAASLPTIDQKGSLVPLGSSKIPETMSSTGGILRSSDRGRTDPMIGQSD